jgi:hypothetical protein
MRFLNFRGITCAILVTLCSASFAANNGNGNGDGSGGVSAEVSELDNRITDLEGQVLALSDQVQALLIISHDRYASAEAIADTQVIRDASLVAHISNVDAHHVPTPDADPEGILESFTKLGSTVYLNDTDLQIDGGNLHVVNGLGLTSSTNSYGNIIIGYNGDRRPVQGDDEIGFSDLSAIRTGSHMLVLGDGNNYTSSGGIIAGTQNTTSARYASVLNGFRNTASFGFSVVTAGIYNEASGSHSAIPGGGYNTASGFISVVSGGLNNEANANYSTVSGGSNNTASGFSSNVSGGNNIQATGASENQPFDSLP